MSLFFLIFKAKHFLNFFQLSSQTNCPFLYSKCIFFVINCLIKFVSLGLTMSGLGTKDWKNKWIGIKIISITFQYLKLEESMDGTGEIMPRFQNTVRNTPLIDLTSFRNTPRMIITQRNTPFTAQFRSMIFGNKQTQETIRYFINTHEKPGKSGFFVAFLRSFHYKMSERFCDTNLKKMFFVF